MMRCSALAPLILLCALGACGRRHGLYADRSIPIVAPAASADGAPRFVGRWARSAAQCADPIILQAHSLRAGGSDCDFDKVEASSGGYAMDAECHTPAGLRPTRLTIATPNQSRISILTISGGPFSTAAALQRCGAS
jgi:hypothetical protein